MIGMLKVQFSPIPSEKLDGTTKELDWTVLQVTKLHKLSMDFASHDSRGLVLLFYLYHVENSDGHAF
ncbi:13605_t:CDS:2 [Ambispora gerdemannii]|uniref:13605_t:CDS:1 n=1 Tax=Ambispora gerdemannii TaxID=144530 RepID=A0A9N8WNC8_9GLOM|nr:13605_t:CDS:2 [Ambispora gerdemannii]